MHYGDVIEQSFFHSNRSTDYPLTGAAEIYISNAVRPIALMYYVAEPLVL